MAAIQFSKLHPDAIIPTRGTPSAAGFDLYAQAETTINGCAGCVLVPTGIAIRIPEGCYGRIAIRSGHAYKHHLCVSAGVIDRDYQGSIGVMVYSPKASDAFATPKNINARWIGDQPCVKPYEYTIQKGERFAQIIIERCSYESAVTVDKIDYDEPMHAGYGSTGK